MSNRIPLPIPNCMFRADRIPSLFAKPQIDLISPLTRACAALILAALTAPGQQPTPGEKTRPSSKSQTYNTPGATYSGTGGGYQVAPQKTKARITAVDLDKRSITVVPAKKGGKFKVAEVGPEGRTWQQVEEMELSFSMAGGQEKISVKGAASKALDKKSMTLEELKPGAEIKIEYYPVPKVIREMTVERVGT